MYRNPNKLQRFDDWFWGVRHFRPKANKSKFSDLLIFSKLQSKIAYKGLTSAWNRYAFSDLKKAIIYSTIDSIFSTNHGMPHMLQWILSYPRADQPNASAIRVPRVLDDDQLQDRSRVEWKKWKCIARLLLEKTWFSRFVQVGSSREQKTTSAQQKKSVNADLNLCRTSNRWKASAWEAVSA